MAIGWVYLGGTSDGMRVFRVWGDSYEGMFGARDVAACMRVGVCVWVGCLG